MWFRSVHRLFVYSGRQSPVHFYETIAQHDVASGVYQGMGMQVGYLFRRHGRMLMQRRDLRNIPGGSMSKGRGRSAGQSLFYSRSWILKRVNTGHPFPYGGKLMRLYYIALIWMRLEAASLYRSRNISRIGLPILVSGKLSAWLIDQPSNVGDYCVVNDIWLMNVELSFKPNSLSLTNDAEMMFSIHKKLDPLLIKN